MLVRFRGLSCEWAAYSSTRNSSAAVVLLLRATLCHRLMSARCGGWLFICRCMHSSAIWGEISLFSFILFFLWERFIFILYLFYIVYTCINTRSTPARSHLQMTELALDCELCYSNFSGRVVTLLLGGPSLWLCWDRLLVYWCSSAIWWGEISLFSFFSSISDNVHRLAILQTRLWRA